MNKPLYAASLLLLLLVLLVFSFGCAKEYSYEQKPIDSVSSGSILNSLVIPCNACRTATLPDSSWRLTIDNVLYCGKVEKAVIPLERTLFTFFGASACSNDSGFVASVYLENEQLNADKANVNAKLACYYYDKLTPSHVYMSMATQPLQLTITTYNHQTGMATGTFRGKVADASGIMREVKDGSFKIRL